LIRTAMTAWNTHVRAQHTPSRGVAGAGLSWDAPGRLPPDLPPDLREMFRRREQGMQSGPDTSPEEGDHTL